MTQMMEKTTLLSFTSRASGAFTHLALAKTQKPSSTASVTLAGNELSVCSVACENNYVELLWFNRNVSLAKTLEISDFGDRILTVLFFSAEYWGYVYFRTNSVPSH